MYDNLCNLYSNFTGQSFLASSFKVIVSWVFSILDLKYKLNYS